MEEDLVQARATHEAAVAATREEAAAAEKHQRELDRLGATLKQVEEYNEKVRVKQGGV